MKSHQKNQEKKFALQNIVEATDDFSCEDSDVIILLDSITRLARAYITVIPHSGKILSGALPRRQGRLIQNEGQLETLDRPPNTHWGYSRRIWRWGSHDAPLYRRYS